MTVQLSVIAKGFQQIEGMNYFETFSLVMKLAMNSVILIYVVIHQWTIRQVNVNNTFFNGFDR